MKLSIKAGSTSQSITVFILDATSGTGAGLTGLVYNSAGLTARYTHSGTYATSTAITLATLAAITSSWSSGGFKEVDAATMPGMYRFDIPNACVQDSKGQSVVLMLYGAANMVPVTIEIEIRGVSFGAVDANVTQINGSLTNGNNAVLSLKSLNIKSDTSGVNSLDIRGYDGLATSNSGGNAVYIKGGTRGSTGLVGGDGVHLEGGLGGADSSLAGYALNVQASGAGGAKGILLEGAYGRTPLRISTDSYTTNGIEILYDGGIGRIYGNIFGSITNVSTSRPVKNVGYDNFMFPMFDSSTKSPKTGLSVTAERAIDGNPFSPCSNAVAELGSGVYRISLSAGDMNGDKIMFRFTATGADDQLIEVFTQG